MRTVLAESLMIFLHDALCPSVQLEDFSEFWNTIGAGHSVKALENHALYDKAVSAPGVKAEIARIFKKLDVTGDGVLELDELAEVVGFYQGYKFDEDEV
jgi:Ca2+-binding EF-hand superfamily protein